MNKVLVVFAHPALERSLVHNALLKKILGVASITFNDLYEHYPDFCIDVAREQSLLLEHDVIVFQHPFYWYSVPPLLKQWFDLVLEHDFAYGHKGSALRGKYWQSVISTGGSESAYKDEGYNHGSMTSFLSPLRATADLCGMHFLPSAVIYGSHHLENDRPLLEAHCDHYGQLLRCLSKADLSSISFDRIHNPLEEMQTLLSEES